MIRSFSANRRQPDADRIGPVDPGEFNPRVASDIAPLFEEVENQRLALKKQFRRRLIITASVTFCLLLIAVTIRILFIEPSDGYSIIENEYIFLLPYGVGGYLLIWSQIPRRRYVRSYKETVLPAVARCLGEFSYDSKGGVCIDRFKDRRILPQHDVYEHEDLFQGRYRGVTIEFCEARLNRSKGERTSANVFRGVLVLLTMNKNFAGTTVVRRDAGQVGNWLRNTFAPSMERVRLEDPVFEEQFEVYSDDQVEARYLLTPAFMTRLMNLSETLGSEKVEAAFYGTQLLIVLPPPKSWRGSSFFFWDFNLGLGGESFGMFEPKSIFTSAYEVDALAMIIDEFKIILSIVDILKLHENTKL